MLVVIGLVVAGTVLLTRRNIDIATHAEGSVAPRAATPDVGLRFSILPTATIMAPEGVMFEGGNWLRQRTMAHSAVLICHPKGLVVFDTGLGRAIDN
ncbi:MAG: hypothetical protein ACKVOL_10860, partial [Novosphingobium sp.]